MGSQNHDSTTVYDATETLLNTEPQGILGTFDRSFRNENQFCIVWARQITILQQSTMQQENVSCLALTSLRDFRRGSWIRLVIPAEATHAARHSAVFVNHQPPQTRYKAGN